MDARTNVSPESSAVPMRPEAVAEFDHWPSGIAPARDGRLFLSFPRVDAVKAPVNLGELIDGTLVPFPDELVNALDPSDAKHRFVNVHGIALAPRNRLLALDTGAVAFDRCDPEAAKLYVIDLEHNVITHGIGFAHDVCLETTYLNDLVVDYNRGKAGFAYISDSSPKGPNAIIVVDLDSGKSLRRLSGSATVRPPQQPGFAIGTELGTLQAPPGVDGIALTPDGRTLWWTPLGGYDLFSIDTDILVAPHPSPEEVERHVVRHDARDFASDGLDSDREGRIYFTDVTNGTVQRLIPSESRYEKLLHGDRYFSWPDAVKLGPDRIVYITDSQVNRMPMFNNGQDLRTPPYRLYRAAIDADPAQY
ncbi:MAG TPA: L-dopachrome tautomerase-related protein [Candidatus Elarobacter sp.]|nr:L-dopachrome tautomerase-related protein [Candidatus Elarobacter sp.]